MEHIAACLRVLHRFFQHIPGISLIGCPVDAVHITDQTGNLSLLGAPRKDGKRIQIRVQIHICLLDPRKPFDGRTIKHAGVVQRLLQLAGRDRHIFQSAENICKLQTDEFHILFLHKTNDVFLRIFTHIIAPSL